MATWVIWNVFPKDKFYISPKALNEFIRKSGLLIHSFIRFSYTSVFRFINQSILCIAILTYFSSDHQPVLKLNTSLNLEMHIILIVDIYQMYYIELLSIRPWKNFSEIRIKIQKIHSWKCISKSLLYLVDSMRDHGMCRSHHRLRSVTFRVAHAPGMLGTFSPPPTSKETVR